MDFFGNDNDKDWWSIYEGRNNDINVNDLQGNFSYEELFKISKEINDYDFKSQYSKYRIFEVSSIDNIEQTFKEIAGSKKARKAFWKINTVLFLIYIFKFILLFGSIFILISLLISFTRFFLIEEYYWTLLSTICLAPFISIFVLDYILWRKYIPIKRIGEIDFSRARNMTGFFKFIYFWYVVRIKNKNDSKYGIYTAKNNKKYLIDLHSFGTSRYYAIRNWYLVSKYIICKKMKISDLPIHFEDQLFFYISNNEYLNDSLKLRKVIFSPKFSLNIFRILRLWHNFLSFLILIVFVISNIIMAFI